MFKKILESRKNGLLKSNFNVVLITAQSVICIIVTVLFITSFQAANDILPLRYASLVGPYDRGEWSRVAIVVIFALLITSCNVVLARLLLKLENSTASTAVLFISTACLCVLLIITLQLAAFTV